jgi:hypothetical protein
MQGSAAKSIRNLLRLAGIAPLQPNDNSVVRIGWDFSWYRRGLLQVPSADLKRSIFKLPRRTNQCGTTRNNARSSRQLSKSIPCGV